MRIRRFCYWLALFGFSTFIAAGVFFYFRKRPRCVIETKQENLWLLSEDGSRMLTYETVKAFVEQKWRSWDTNTGQKIAEWDGTPRLQRVQPSKDGRHIIYSNGKLLRLIDWQAGEHWDIDVAVDIGPFGFANFSSSGRWLLVRGPANYSLIDVPARKLASEFSERSAPSFITATSIEDRVLSIWTGEETALWDIEAKKAVGILPPLLQCGDSDCPVSSEGLWCVGVTDGQDSVTDLEVWDAIERKLRCRHALPKPNRGLRIAFPADPRRIALTYERGENAVVEMVDTDTGKSLWSFATKKIPGVDFSPDSSLIGLFHHRDETGFVTMLDAETGRVLWELPSEWPILALRANVVLHLDEADNRYCFLDARTGIRKAALPFALARWGAVHPRFLRKDERHLLVSGERKLDREPYLWEAWLHQHWPEVFSFNANHVLVMETATRRELLHITKFGTFSANLSEDARTLIIIDRWSEPEPRQIIRIWDVSPTKAWLWAIGSGLAATVVWHFVGRPGIRLLRRRRSNAASAETQPNTQVHG